MTVTQGPREDVDNYPLPKSVRDSYPGWQTVEIFGYLDLQIKYHKVHQCLGLYTEDCTTVRLRNGATAQHRKTAQIAEKLP